MIKLKNNHKAFSLIELSIVILIIGILVIGITNGSRIINQARLKSAKSLTISSPVNSMSGLILWLDASNSATIATGTAGSGSYDEPSDNSLVTDWRDQNTQNSSPLVLSAPADTNRPTYIQSSIGSLPTLQFNGSTTYLSNSNGVFYSGEQEYTIIAVWNTTSTTSQQMIFNQYSSCAKTNAGMLAGNGGHLTSWGCGGGDYDGSSYQKNVNYISTVRVNKTLANQASVYLNSNTPQSGSPASSGTLGSGTTAVGAYGTGAGGFLSGQISEVIVFSRALKDSEVTAAQQYLSSKYSIVLR